MSNILDSYLVRLGATVDTNSFNKFNLTLLGSENSVLSFSKKLISGFAKLEFSVVGALTSVGTGLITLADKTAMADQQYRLFGMRMLMTKESARAMQVATDELGASLDEIAYDPELNRRFQYLYEQNIKLGREMGLNFNSNMMSIRDIIMEYQRFSKELDFLSSGVISSLFEKLGFGSGDLQNKLHWLNDWFSENLPKISDQISSGLIPVWDNWVVVTKDLAGIFKTAAGEFTYFTGIVTGDDSIKSTEFSMKGLASATLDWVDALTEAALAIQLVFKTGLHATSALMYGFQAWRAELKGDTKEETRLLGLRDSEKSGFIKDFNDIVTGDGSVNNNPDFSGFREFFSKQEHRGDKVSNPDIYKSILEASRKYGIDPNFLSAIIHRESNYNPGTISPKGAMGLMQLEPQTAKDLGVDNPFNAQQNIEGGAKYLHQLIKKYGSHPDRVLAAYNAGPANVDKYGGVPPFAETKSYVDSVLSDYTRYSNLASKNGEAVHIENLNITVPHTLPQEDWTRFIRESMKDLTTVQNRTVMAQTAGGAYR